LKNLEALKNENIEKSRQISILSEEKTLFGCKEQAYQFKISSLEGENSHLESELNLARDEAERLKTKLNENIDIVSVLKKSIMNVIEEKQNETICTKNLVKDLEESLLKIEKDYDKTLQENERLKQNTENESLLHNKDEIIKRLNIQLQESEASRKSLQEQLLNVEKKMDDLVKNQMDKEDQAVSFIISLFF